jgi:hypothetical protein
LSCNMHCIQQCKLICMFRCLVVHVHSNVIRSPVISCLAWLQLCWSCNTVNPKVMFLLPETYSFYNATMLHPQRFEKWSSTCLQLIGCMQTEKFFII